MKILSILLFFVFATLIPIKIKGQTLLKEDSLQILKYVKELNRSLAYDLFEGEQGFSDEIIDSVLSSNRMGYGGGNVYYSPDSSFKIYVIEGNGGGAYGISVHESFIQFKNGKALNIIEPLFPITDIHQIGKKTYIIIQNFWTRGASVHTENNYKVTQISIENDTLTYVPFKFPNSNPIYNKNQPGSFTIYTYHFYENLDKTFMYYDSKNRKLVYSFIIDHYQASSYHEEILDKFKNENQIAEVKGSFVVKDGTLQFNSEVYRGMDFKFEEE